MQLSDLYAEDLVYEREATERTGIPGPVLRKWASRGRIRRFPGDGRPSGLGHGQRTMYALPEIKALAATYKPTPQRRPRQPTP
ncbi:hypothetical protein [Streptomyces sp. NPDC088674]|uniref:hypothetical protein n=1 Tax=Streptomyces sp. NPDC088674 TaxID=3365869 RepID=UPI0037FFAEBB